MDKEPFSVTGATLAFYRYEADGLVYYEFDATECEPPEPMVNALRGLQLLDTSDKRLLMINMQEPEGLYLRIADAFAWEVSPRENGDVEIVFRRKTTF